MNAPEFDSETLSAALTLKGPLNISSVERLQEVVTRYASQASDLQIDLSGVEACDAAGLQLLCSLRSSAAALDKSVRIIAVSESFTSLIRALGVSVASLELPAGMAGTRGTPVAGISNQGDPGGI